MPPAFASSPTQPPRTGWGHSLAGAVRSGRELLARLDLPPSLASIDAESDFACLVPRSLLARMTPGDPADPILRQVLPVDAETRPVAGFTHDAVGDAAASLTPGLIQKYRGRVLLIATGACAVHCRYCFRRHFPYGEGPRRLDDFRPAIDAVAADDSTREVILSGGDPLMLTDQRLSDLLDLIEQVPHVRRLRIHTRLPIVLPDRICDALLTRLRGSRLQTWVVVHANHAREVRLDCADALAQLVNAGLPVLNQAVWLAGVNDSADAQAELCESLIDLGVQPYYLHLLDRTQGTAHFEASESAAADAIAALTCRLPGYAVPRLVREIAGEPSKTPIAYAPNAPNRPSEP